MNLDDPETLREVIAEAIDGKELEERHEKGDTLLYAPNEHKPYTGWRLVKYENGENMGLGYCQHGKLDGQSVGWSSKGRKEEESIWKYGKIMTYVKFKPNGEKCPETNIVNGNGVLVLYEDNGSIAARGTCEDGEVVFDVEKVDDQPKASKKKAGKKRKRKSVKKNTRVTLPEAALNCLPPFALMGGLVYFMEKYWGMDLEDADSKVLVVSIVAFWGIVLGWFYFVDLIKKNLGSRGHKRDRMDTRDK